MQKLVVENKSLTALNNARGPLELRDHSGQTIGYFVPAVRHGSEKYEWAETQISDEELNRRKYEPDGRSTAEILEWLSARWVYPHVG